MRYMFLIYSRETDMAGLSAADMDKLKAAHWAVMDETRAKGILHGAEPLHPTATATTVRMNGGKPLVLDGPFAETKEQLAGPFAETKEQLAGYYILDCKDLDEAIAWASRIPTACKGGEGCVEIRPIMALPAR
jgi:hypothetical protein